ncbi:hypothetical protein ACWENQ_44650 [Nonomuraea sp. NPDC004354]
MVIDDAAGHDVLLGGGPDGRLRLMLVQQAELTALPTACSSDRRLHSVLAERADSLVG